MHYQCNLAAVAGSRCTGARSGVVTERGSRGIGAAQKVLSPHTAVMPKETGTAAGVRALGTGGSVGSFVAEVTNDGPAIALYVQLGLHEEEGGERGGEM